MENAEENSKADMHDLRKEAILNAATPAGAANMLEQDDDPELQYLDQTDKINNSKKKSFFQITSVIENVNDENDSMDELDESRADDLSTADLSKVSLQTDVEQSETDDSPAPPGSALNPNAALNPINVESNGNGPSRFKLVKVARIEPIKRGRWTCKDFPNEPQAGVDSTVAKTEQLKDNVSGSSSTASSVHYVPGENPPTDNPLNDNMNSAPQQPPLQPPPPSNDKTSEEATSSRSKKDNPASMTNHRPSHKTGSPKEPLSKKESSAGDFLSLDLLNVDHLDNQSEGDESTSGTGGAIDNKIEQAMDLVKSHLLFAVREEVEVLKEQIKELLEKNEKLQRENAHLRQSQSQALHRSYKSEAPPPSLPPPAQDQAGFPALATPAAAAPRTDGYAPQQQQPAPVGLQTAGGPAHGQAPPPSQPQTLPQQQAGQYGHLQPTQPPQAQQQHTLPQQTTQQPPSQT